MSKNRAGNFMIVGLVILNVLLWLLFPPANDGRAHYLQQYLGEMFSTSAIILLACGQILASRPRILEPYFGGLDRMYVSHKNCATFAITLLYVHFFTMSISGGFRLNISLGKLALIGFSAMILLALAPRIPFAGGYLNLPYHTWRLTHRFIGIFFIIGLTHMLTLDSLIKQTPVVFGYILIIGGTGVTAYLYKQFVYGPLLRRHPYQVSELRRLNGSVLELTLKPIKEKIRFKPGQFLFIGFSGDKNLKEHHPFTISSTPADEQVRLAVKVSGDFTARLHKSLLPGTQATVAGGYGMFDYRSGLPEQVWVAGGIGITPFLSWVRTFPLPTGYSAHLIYSVRAQDETLYLPELQAAAATQAGFSFHPFYSTIDGRLTVDKMQALVDRFDHKDFYFCGPFAMTQALTRDLIQSGVPAGRIHYEEFNFR